MRKHPFFRVTPNLDQQATMAGLGQKLASVYEDISASIPDSVYKTEALKYLEIVGMLTSKGITHGTT